MDARHHAEQAGSNRVMVYAPSSRLDVFPEDAGRGLREPSELVGIHHRADIFPPPPFFLESKRNGASIGGTVSYGFCFCQNFLLYPLYLPPCRWKRHCVRMLFQAAARWPRQAPARCAPARLRRSRQMGVAGGDAQTMRKWRQMTRAGSHGAWRTSSEDEAKRPWRCMEGISGCGYGAAYR